MKSITCFSNMIIPLLIFYVVGYGILSKRDIYSDFLEGAEDGLKTVAGLAPALIGLLTAVGILRASGFLEFVGNILSGITSAIGLPAQLVPLALIRMFSSSAAAGLLLDIFKKFGADSSTGLMAGIMLCSTESVFYCISIYYGSAKIKKTRYTLPGALLATIAGAAAAVCIVNCLM